MFGGESTRNSGARGILINAPDLSWSRHHEPRAIAFAPSFSCHRWNHQPHAAGFTEHPDAVALPDPPRRAARTL